MTEIDPPAPWIVRSPHPSGGGQVGAVVREYRLAWGQSQVAIASAMGVTQQYLSQIENGVRNVSIEQRLRLADVLGIPPEDLGLAVNGHRSQLGSGSEGVAATRGRWRVQRHWLNHHRAELAHWAAALYPTDQRVFGTPLIAPPDWVPAEPISLHGVTLELDDKHRGVVVTGREPESLPTRPLRAEGVPFDRYTAAVRHLDPPQLFESRPSYRYLGGSIAHKHLTFGMAAYFDKLDVSEALGHEMAIACVDGAPSDPQELASRLPFRQLVGEPFDPLRRAIVPAITTLTIRLRRYPTEPSFLLHWRDPGKVATAAGVYDVVPAGEFQPSTVALWDLRNDFSIWRNMVREYAEELLGNPEHDGTRTEAIDYSSWSLYQELEQALDEGKITVSVLGMGLDALTLAATILTVVVIDDDTFDRVFGATVQFNDEGEIVGLGGGRSADGVPFTEDSVARMLTTEPMAPPGAAALALAWRHRDILVG